MLDVFDLQAMNEGRAISHSLRDSRYEGKASRHKITSYVPKPKRVKSVQPIKVEVINPLLEFLKGKR